MISETDDTINSDIDQSRHIMLDMISKIDKLNDDDENYSLKSPENGSIEIILEKLSFSQTRDVCNANLYIKISCFIKKLTSISFIYIILSK